LHKNTENETIISNELSATGVSKTGNDAKGFILMLGKAEISLLSCWEQELETTIISRFPHYPDL